MLLCIGTGDDPFGDEGLHLLHRSKKLSDESGHDHDNKRDSYESADNSDDDHGNDCLVYIAVGICKTEDPVAAVDICGNKYFLLTVVVFAGEGNASGLGDKIVKDRHNA